MHRCFKLFFLSFPKPRVDTSRWTNTTSWNHQLRTVHPCVSGAVFRKKFEGSPFPSPSQKNTRFFPLPRCSECLNLFRLNFNTSLNDAIFEAGCFISLKNDIILGISFGQMFLPGCNAWKHPGICSWGWGIGKACYNAMKVDSCGNFLKGWDIMVWWKQNF